VVGPNGNLIYYSNAFGSRWRFQNAIPVLGLLRALYRVQYRWHYLIYIMRVELYHIAL
jgi:hypothetical protein